MKHVIYSTLALCVVASSLTTINHYRNVIEEDYHNRGLLLEMRLEVLHHKEEDVIVAQYLVGKITYQQATFHMQSYTNDGDGEAHLQKVLARNRAVR